VISSFNAATTLRVSARVAVWATGDDESVALTVNVEVVPVGTPLIVPSEANPSPTGNDPETSAQRTMPTEPDVTREAVYEAP
jgi:hypothetical protein